MKRNASTSDALICDQCGRQFTQDTGIWNLLPVDAADSQAKQRESEGWQAKSRTYRELPPDEHYLRLPDVPLPYYEKAARGLRIVQEIMRPLAGKKILELGAAECWATRQFAEQGAEAVALEYSNDPDRFGKSQILLDRLPIHFLRVLGDAERIPFADETFDHVFCCSVFHHFPDARKAAREIARVLKPGGSFCAIGEAIHPLHMSRQKALLEDEETAANLKLGINEQSFTLRQYAAIFRQAGLVMVVIHPWWDVQEMNGSIHIAPGTNRPRKAQHSGIWSLLINRWTFPLLRHLWLHLNCRELVLVFRKP